MRKNKVINIIFGVIFLSAITIWVGVSFYKYDKLSHDFVITEGKINRIAPATYKNNNRSILYEYTVNGKKYIGENSLSLCGNLTNEYVRILLVNRNFPVAYSPKDVNLSIIIITEKDANRFNHLMTDSLRMYDSILTCR